jgi:tetratricopeptide (TPR) repeat protein
MAIRRRTPVGRGIRERAAVTDTAKHASGTFKGILQAGPARPIRAHGLSDEHQDRGLLYAEKQLWDDAIKEFQKSVEFTPEFAEGLNNLGVCFLYTHRHDEAADALALALRHFPGWTVAQANLGLVFQRKKEYEKAVEFYRQALQKQTQQPQVWAALGECYETLGRLDDAEDAYRRALAAQAKYDTALYRLGLLLARKNELDEAERHLRAALELDAELVEAWAVLGAIQARHGQLTHAREYFEKARQLRPDKVPGAAARGLAQIEAYEQRVKAQFAELKREYAAEDLPAVAECYFNAGLAFVKDGQLDKAHAAFLAATMEDPEWPEPRVWAGMLDGVLGRPAAARSELEAARKLEARNPLLCEAIGATCLALGYPKEAERNFQEARALGREVPPGPA